ncbi:MAG: lysophospholipid acyltransferase family protein [Caldimicrobium sp.]
MFPKLFEIFRNLLLWIYVLLTVPIFGTLAILTKKHFLARIWCELLLKILGIKIRVLVERWPEKGKNYVFMCNHQSQLDIPVLESVLKDYNIRFLAKKSLFEIPFFGWGIKALGYIPVEREDPKEGLKSLLACVEKLKEGYSLIVFPEGTRSKTGELLPFKIGGFLIPIKAGVSVCPVAIWGTHYILSKGSLWMRLKEREVRVYIGPVIDVSGLTLKDKYLLLEKVREAIEQGLEKIKF